MSSISMTPFIDRSVARINRSLRSRLGALVTCLERSRRSGQASTPQSEAISSATDANTRDARSRFDRGNGYPPYRPVFIEDAAMAREMYRL